MSANAAYQSFEQGDVGGGLFNAGMAALGARGAMSNARSASKGCLFNCFAEGTLVLTEDGERPIEEIEVGDRVWAWNEETGESELAEVVRVFERETLEVYTLHVGVGEVLEATDEHPFWVVGRGWTEIEDLRPGDILTSYEGQELRLVAVERQERVLQVYNFEVRGLQTYFVGDARVLVHNCETTVLYHGSINWQGEKFDLGISQGMKRPFSPKAGVYLTDDFARATQGYGRGGVVIRVEVLTTFATKAKKTFRY